MKTTRWILPFLLFVLCGACNPTVTPSPENPGPTQVRILEPEMNAVLGLGPQLLEFDSTALLGIDTFRILVNGETEASVAPTSVGSCGSGCGHSFYGEYIWTPDSTGVFTISISAHGNGVWGEAGEVQVTVVQGVAEMSTPPSLQPTPADDGKAKVSGKQNSNCRDGGGVEYRVLAVLMQGETADAVAVSGDGLYVKVIPPGADVKCWIFADLLEFVAGRPQSLPVEPFAPAPAEEPGPSDSKPAGVP
jgi:hypothetical protein